MSKDKVELNDLMDIYICLDQHKETSKPVIRKISFSSDDVEAMAAKHEGSWTFHTQIDMRSLKDSIIWEHCEKHKVDYIKGSKCYPCGRV